MPDKYVKKIVVPIKKTGEEDKRASDTDLDIDFSPLLPDWDKLQRTLDNYQNDPYKIIAAYHNFKNLLIQFIHDILTRYEVEHEGYFIAFGGNIARHFISEFFDLLKEKQGTNFYRFSDQQAEVVFKLTIFINIYNTYFKKRSTLSTYTKTTLPLILKEKLEQLFIDESSTTQNTLDDIIRQFDDSENGLVHLFYMIASEEQQKQAKNITELDHNLSLSVLKEIFPAQFTNVSIEDLIEEKKDNKVCDCNQIEQKILNFMYILTLYIIQHPTMTFSHDRHPEIALLLGKAQNLLTNEAELQKPAIDRQLELFKFALLIDKKKGALHNTILAYLKPENFELPKTPLLKSGRFKQKYENMIDACINNYKKTTEYKLANKTSSLNVSERKKTNEENIKKIPVSVVNHYCEWRGYSEKNADKHHLIKILEDYFYRLYAWFKLFTKADVALNKDLSNNGYISKNKYRVFQNSCGG